MPALVSDQSLKLRPVKFVWLLFRLKKIKKMSCPTITGATINNAENSADLINI